MDFFKTKTKKKKKSEYIKYLVKDGYFNGYIKKSGGVMDEDIGGSRGALSCEVVGGNILFQNR